MGGRSAANAAEVIRKAGVRRRRRFMGKEESAKPSAGKSRGTSRAIYGKRAKALASEAVLSATFLLSP
jgi:hypothetical protein